MKALYSKWYRICKRILIFFLLLVCIYFILLSIQIRKENTHDVILDLPLGTTDNTQVLQYTKQCTESTLPRDMYPRGVMGISGVGPYDDVYFSLMKKLSVYWLRAEFHWRPIEQSEG